MIRSPHPHLAGLLMLVAIFDAGCGSAGSGTPTDGDSGAASTSGAPKSGAVAASHTQAVHLAECIRSQGVKDFPDPTPKGDFEYGISVSPAVWQKAVNACKEFEPPGTFSSVRSPKEQTGSLEVAACIRAHGVKDFPDPANGDPMIDTTKIPSSNRPGGMAILNAAIASCRSVLDGALGGQR